MIRDLWRRIPSPIRAITFACLGFVLGVWYQDYGLYRQIGISGQIGAVRQSIGILSSPLLTPSLSEVVEKELRKLAPGHILFNPPEEMKAGVKERVEVRIAKNLTEDLTAGLRGRGEPQIEEIKVGTFMKTRLLGDNFKITTLSHEKQVVTGEGFTEWDWDVLPLKSGSQKLILIVTVRIKIPGSSDETMDYPVFEREVNVKVNIIYCTTTYIKAYWHWAGGTIISSGIIRWFIRRRRKARIKRAAQIKTNNQSS